MKELTHHREFLMTWCNERGFWNQNNGLSRPFQLALGKVYFLVAAAAHMCSIKFIREDFHFLGTIRAFACKRF
jgi:hypothetical protein